MAKTVQNELSFDDCALYVARVLLNRSEDRARQTAYGFERSLGFDAGMLMQEARRLAVD